MWEAFSRLGKYWLGGDGPELAIIKSKEDVRSAMHDILSDAQCTNIEVVVYEKTRNERKEGLACLEKLQVVRYLLVRPYEFHRIICIL